MYLIKEMKEEERPRERLIALGAKVLTSEELLAVLLRTGSKECSVLELARKVIQTLDFFKELDNISVEELMLTTGIKAAKACSIVAAIELGKRLNEERMPIKSAIKEAKDIYNLLSDELCRLNQEHFLAIYLDVKSNIIKKETIFIGSINQTLIHPRELFKNAIKFCAYSIIFIHNHPSGDSEASKADIAVTERLIEIGELLGIIVLDHLIIGKNEFYSIRKKERVKC